MMSSASLARRLGLADAIVLGLASMVGAGVFVVFAPAAHAAGVGLLAGLAIAAVIALCNALSSAQLAAVYPVSGGAYSYGRERLGEWPGFLAGWSFVVGKLASCAAMALAFASYIAPPAWHRPIAAATVLGLVALSSFGITRTAGLARVLVAIVLVALVVVILSGFFGGRAPEELPPLAAIEVTAYGVLQSAGLLFFAFAGFARIATLGEEVRDPSKTIPRAILTALAIVLVLYLSLAISLLAVLGPVALSMSSAPLRALIDAAGWGWAAPIVLAGAAAGALGALLALIAGVGRTMLAMAREGDLPAPLAVVDSRYSVPRRADLLIALVLAALVLTVDLREVIGFSSFGVLLYYFVANVAAFTQPKSDRRYPRALNLLGALGCLVLVVTLPWQSIVAGVTLLIVGTIYRLASQARRRQRTRS
ncbi:MAG: APC family permease [Rhodoglobus sp.]